MNEIFRVIRNIVTVFKYEFKRYIFSSRFLFLFVACMVPTLFYVSFAGKNAALEIHLHLLRYDWLSAHVLKTYVMFAYILNILVVIITVNEMFASESALELLLSACKRFELFIGKIVTIFAIILFTSLFSWIGCIIAFQGWNVEIPITLDDFTFALLLLLFVSLLPLTVSVFSNTLEMKIRTIGGIGSALPIFIFFVIPFFIFSSVYLGFASEDMMLFSTYFRISKLTDYHLMPEQERKFSFDEANEAFTAFSLIILISVFLAWLLFYYADTKNKRE